MESQRQPACAAHIISLAHCRAERRPPQHATPYAVPCGICHQCSLGELRATPGMCALAHCATLRREGGCAGKTPAACAWMHRPSPPPTGASQSRTEATPAPTALCEEVHADAPLRKAASSAAVATAGRYPRRRRTSHHGCTSHEPASRAPAAARSASCGRRPREVQMEAVPWPCRFETGSAVPCFGVHGRSVLPASSNAEPHDMTSAVPMMGGMLGCALRPTAGAAGVALWGASEEPSAAAATGSPADRDARANVCVSKAAGGGA